MTVPSVAASCLFPLVLKRHSRDLAGAEIVALVGLFCGDGTGSPSTLSHRCSSKIVAIRANTLCQQPKIRWANFWPRMTSVWPLLTPYLVHNRQAAFQIRGEGMRAHTDRFDYQATAELFLGRNPRGGTRHPKYKRFDRAGDAIRFAIERLSNEVLIGTYLEVDEK